MNKQFFLNYFKYKSFRKQFDSQMHLSLELKEPNYIKLTGRIFLGENCKLLCWGKYTSGIEIQELSPKLTFGHNIRVTRNLVIQCANRIIIGNDVLIASNAFIRDYNHELDHETVNYLDNPLNVSSVEIKYGVWIGNNVIILFGVSIGKKSIVAVESVVTKSVPDYSIAAGNQAIKIKNYDFENKCWQRVKGELII